MPVNMTSLRRERRRARLCIICARPAAEGNQRCEHHARLNRSYYYRRRMKRAEEVAAPEPIIVPPPPEGTNPQKCEPFRDHAAPVMQRLDCARRRACLDYAVRLEWRAFTCGGCRVREMAARVEPPTRRSFEGALHLPRSL